MKRFLINPLTFCVLAFVQGLFCQEQLLLDRALQSLHESREYYGLSESDLKDLMVSDYYDTEHNGVHHFYFKQRYEGIEIYNAITSVHVAPDGKVYNSPNRFYSGIAKKINSTKPRINSKQALLALIRHYNIPNAILPEVAPRAKNGAMLFSKTNFTHNDIPVKLVYQPMPNGNLRLAWDIELALRHCDDYWSTRIDAITGQVLDEHNLTIKCSFDKKARHTCKQHAAGHDIKDFVPVHDKLAECHAEAKASGTYRVFELPKSSPLDGDRSLAIQPHNPKASPFGWHDTNGAVGPEYTTTRGNNVYAYLDRVPDNFPDGNDVDGGPGLVFDFPYNPNSEPPTYSPASITNLFYLNNMMHDITYEYGFDEKAGNFQTNNYGKGGVGNDPVRAECQDGSGSNNANFSTPADGQSGTMQMYIWSNVDTETSVIAPDTIAGVLIARRGEVGVAPTANPIEADVIIAADGSPKPTLGCRGTYDRNLTNGKIILIDRGECEFGVKAQNAERAGAVAVIICNFEDAMVSMGAGAVGRQVRIPAYFTTRSICNRLKAFVDKGLRIRIQLPQGNEAGPDSLDSSLDNEIIAHEYGHGVSTRLTGGPSSVGCLTNPEQMGEGWSDFFSLVVTAKPGAKGEDPLSIGSYANGDKKGGFGVRRKLYTTDMKINNFTYKDIDTEVHNLGEVWTLVLWDLYWAFANKYGYDPDYKNKSAGNNIALQLVMDGMKLQPCRPGFIDGRNAILKADSIKYGGANSCLIWEVFARRGMGVLASQGSSNIVFDETESYLPFLTCINKVDLKKRAGRYNAQRVFVPQYVVKPGDDITFTIEVNNYKPGSSTQVTVLDRIPDGCTYVPNSANIAPVISGNTLRWDFSSLRSLENKTIVYKVKTDANAYSETLLYDDLDSDNTIDQWEVDLFKGRLIWALSDFGINNSNAWSIDEDSGYSNDSWISRIEPFRVTGRDPSLLFYHYFNTEPNFDAGMLEVSADNGLSWTHVSKDEFSLNPYNGTVSYSTFVIPNLHGFSGYSETFIPSVVSLNKYRGKDIRLRFRFGFDSLNIGTGASPYKGWIFDNYELIDPKFYNSEICLNSAQGDNVCIQLDGKGVLADSRKIVNTNDADKDRTSIVVYPNPAKDYFVINFPSNTEIDQLNIFSPSGQLIANYAVKKGTRAVRLQTREFPKGVLTIQCIGKDLAFHAKLLLK